MKYYIYSDNTPARWDGAGIPELWLNGRWKRFYHIDIFGHNAVEIPLDEIKERFPHIGFGDVEREDIAHSG